MVSILKDIPIENLFQRCHPRIFLSGVHFHFSPGFPLNACGNDGLR